MIKLILCAHILTTLFIIHSHTIKAPPDEDEVSQFEYGVHIPGEELSFIYTDSIPPFQPIFTINATPSVPGLEKQFTYLKAEFINPVSKVMITFDPKTFILTVHQKFPFITMPIGVHGFSMPIRKQKKLKSRS